MGAKQRAQHRGNKAPRGSMKGQPVSQRQLNQSIQVSDLSATSRARSLQNGNAFVPSSDNHHGFSMTEQARNTDRRTLGWGAAPLRTQAITFVSAGPLKREEDAWNTVSEDDSPQKKSDAELAPSNAPPNDQVGQEQVQETHEQLVSSNIPDHSLSPSQVPQREEHGELLKSEDHHPVITSPVVLSPPSPSSDSDEEIIFTGRTGVSQPSRKQTPVPHQAQQSVPKPHAATAESSNPPPQSYQPSTEVATSVTFDNSITLSQDSPLEVPNSSRLRSKRTKDLPIHRKLFGKKYDEDALMQDYIDNMALDDTDEEDENSPTGTLNSGRKKFKKTETIRMFNGDGLENAKVQTVTNGSKKSKQPIPDQPIDWDSDDLADFDDLSTTDEEVSNIDQVIRHRTRVSGAQYLVVASGADAGDAKWMLQKNLISESAVREIQIYEDIREMNIVEEDYDDDDSDEDEDEEEALQDLLDNIESEDDENARIMNYASRMTDEQIARVLAKQEELGLGGDELMLFDGEAAGGEGVVGDSFVDGEDFIPFSLGKHTSNRGRSKRNKKQRDSFPSAEAFADALDQDPYGAFDIMDFERPSLRPKKKGRKSDFPWDLGDLDEDLRQQLVSTWTKDREKKAERKRQKEEDRLAASLDAEDAGDPAIIKTRIRQFLVQDVEVLKLSPMEAAVRAAVHRLAKALKLNSRSEGKEGVGIGRYPVLTKTPRTPSYTVETVWEIDALMNTRKFFPKNFYGSSNRVARPAGVARLRRGGGGGGGGGVMSGATYRDGEIVGASAPELGADNKGRAMLEKMGWTHGMAIGAEGNKGSLDHVRHIVKTTKAGLG